MDTNTWPLRRVKNKFPPQLFQTSSTTLLKASIVMRCVSSDRRSEIKRLLFQSFSLQRRSCFNAINSKSSVIS